MDMRTPQRESDTARLTRERDFHDGRFEQEVRQPQRKYYWAVQDAFAAYAARRAEHSLQADVLEYGCAKGRVSCQLAPAAKSITGIDISGVAIEQAEARACAAGLQNTRFAVMNAEAMDFADQSFDFIFGSGIIHHLDIGRAYDELYRVLRPGGRVLFIEPLGHNPVLGLYRRLTPAVRSVDEHPLKKADFQAFAARFDDVRTRHFGLFTLGAVPFRHLPGGSYARAAARAADRAFFAMPFAKWWAWFCVMEGQKSEG